MTLSFVYTGVKINAPKWVLSWIEHGVPIRFINPPSAFELPNHPMNSKETMFIDHEIDQLLQLRYIEQYDADHKPICMNPINCVPKKKTSSSMQWRIYGGVRTPPPLMGQHPISTDPTYPDLVHHKCKISYLKFLNKLILLL